LTDITKSTADQRWMRGH